jgi:flagellar assembly protein FliH
VEYSFDALQPPPGAQGHAVLDPIGVAVSEAEAIREAARREGWEAGRLEAHTEVRMELEPAAHALAAAAGDLVRAATERAAVLEQQSVELALSIAEKVVAGALEVEPERVCDVVAGALRTLVERERVVIEVHPDDAELVRESVDAVAAQLGGVSHLDVQADRRVARGGAVVRTDEGDVEATAEAKLERVREVVMRELRSA